MCGEGGSGGGYDVNKGRVCGGGGEKHTAEEPNRRRMRRNEGAFLQKVCTTYRSLSSLKRVAEDWKLATSLPSIEVRSKKRTKLIGDSGPHGVENLRTEVHSAGGTADVSGNSGCVQFCVVRLVR